ncbi:hypothetical protein ACEPAI_1960 [Sanghuangporus weigelae]
MSSICANGTLPARPDIEGIGTRIATYAQVFLTIFTIALTPAARSFDAWWAVLVTSLGLQFAAIAQRHDLTLFHALVVTLLAFPIFGMSWVFIFLHWREACMPLEIHFATHIHGFLFIGFGLWIWATAPTFGVCPELNDQIQFVIFGKSVSPLGWVRTLVLVLYSIWALMFLCAAAVAIIRGTSRRSRAYSRQLDRSPSSSTTRDLRDLRHINTYLSTRYGMLVFVTCFNLLVLAYGIWGVETLLMRNVTGQSRNVESSWTFGQLSAIILLVGPGFTFMRLLRFRFFGSTGVTGTDREGMPLTSPRAEPSASAERMDEKGRRDFLNKSESGISA